MSYKSNVKAHTMAMLGHRGRHGGRTPEAEAQMLTQRVEQPRPQPRLPTPGAILRCILGR